MSEAATQNHLTINLVTPEGSLFEGEAGFVAVPGHDGEIGILPHHTALIARLGTGSLRIVEGKVLILAAEAVDPESLTEDGLAAERTEVLEALQSPESDESYAALLERRRWLETREGILRAAG